MSYNANGHEFNVNESTVYVKYHAFEPKHIQKTWLRIGQLMQTLRPEAVRNLTLNFP
jgi:hypothetical protein